MKPKKLHIYFGFGTYCGLDKVLYSPTIIPTCKRCTRSIAVRLRKNIPHDQPYRNHLELLKLMKEMYK